jgi:serine/threonine protein kinase
MEPHSKHSAGETDPSRVSSHCEINPGSLLGDKEFRPGNSLKVIGYLGRGRVASVYEARSYPDSPVAVKVFRGVSWAQRDYANEVKVMTRVLAESADPPNVVRFLYTFAHVQMCPQGANQIPVIHPCIVYGLYGDSVSSLLKYCRRTHGGGAPITAVKRIMTDTLRGLAFLHSLSITHTDIKPSNLLLNNKIDSINPDNFSVFITDLGTANIGDEIFSYHVGTTEYCAPELILEMKYGVEVDVWSTFAMCYELITGDLLFDVYNIDGVGYAGGDIDDVLIQAEDKSERSSKASRSSSAGDDSSGDENEDPDILVYRHLALMQKILGQPPKKLTKQGRTHYNHTGALKNHPVIEQERISSRLSANYNIAEEECAAIEAFLLSGLRYSPQERISAARAMKHQWLKV